MNLCSYTLTCSEYKIDFITKIDKSTFRLYKNSKEIYSLYPIKKSDEFFLKIYMPYKKYNVRVYAIYIKTLKELLVIVFIVALLSILFSFYSLYPLRKALLLTREFIKDILHDVNTPMATMRLNLSMLKNEIGENRKINRIERAIDNLLLLQENLKHYLLSHKLEIEDINLKKLLEDRVDMIEKNYSNLTYTITIDSNIYIRTNKKGLTRIIDNIIGNASKYNIENGKVDISYQKEKKILTISDSGIGIKNPSKAFDRFYKENDRGVGIGLHIVKKLCNELNIEVSIESKVKVGTTIFLKF